MSALQLCLLGPLCIRRAARELPRPPTVKSQSLLAYLALHREHPQPRERLADLFWGERPEARARRSLNTALWHIRRLLEGGDCVLSDALTVQWNPQLDLWLDVDVFEACLSRGGVADLEAAVALYRGEFLEGLYDDWVVDERYRVESLFGNALACLMVAQEQQAGYERALATALRLLRHDPLREEAHRVAHARLLPPGPAQRRVGAVPAPPHLVGRDGELRLLAGCWQEAQAGPPSLVLVSGEAGVGKTRLVESLAERQEFEYIRRGTQTLIANLEVATGEVPAPSIGATRTEIAFAEHIAHTLDLDPDAEGIFVTDRLDIHMSESLVRLVAERCGIDADLGVKEKQGILLSRHTRAAFLQDPSHRIRFVYTPKHTSWLNQMELWFGMLVRRLLKRASFTSVEDLRQRILAFIDHFNRTMPKPFKWTYAG